MEFTVLKACFNNNQKISPQLDLMKKSVTKVSQNLETNPVTLQLQWP